uniref:XK-related protein n=1 Tax=Cynoglossus semilaevis TaxID=244447 RepID=A0A3P8VXT0_CYNSE
MELIREIVSPSSVIYCFVYYLWVGHNYCYAYLAGCTALFLLPGWAPQWLSYLWYLSDGRIRRKSLTWTHILHLGIFKRLWECMCLPEEDVYGEIMQQADVSALRLFEALVVTLPETLLQAYVLICTDIGIKSPVCFVVCLVSLSWALVVYARACLLIRPGHLQMTPAALLCRLLWRVSMLGSRFAVLMLFTRIFKQWILGVIGVHWLGATFWMVSQQTDIIKSTSRWRIFNLVLGAVHIFLFLNVKYGPSRYRMTGFYLVMFLENALLLLASSWLFTMVSWDTKPFIYTYLFIALVLYYRFLHPKSFEIFQSIRHKGIGGACMERGSTLSLEEKVTPTQHGIMGSLWEGWKHHHWLLIRLALKTGDKATIWSAYGEGGLAGLMGDEEFQSAACGSPSLSSARHPGSLQRINSNAATLTEASSSVASLEITTPAWSPERRSPLLIGSPEKKPGTPLQSNATLYFSVDAQSPSSGSYLGWGSELSPISSYRSPYRIREARFITSTPRAEPPPTVPESPGPASVVVIPATPTPGATPVGSSPRGSASAASTPSVSTPLASTPAASTPAASTPGATTPAATTPSTPVVPLTPVISHARKQIAQIIDSGERLV